MDTEAPPLPEVLAALVRRIEHAKTNAQAELAAEAGILFGYLLGVYRPPGAHERAQVAAEVVGNAAAGHLDAPSGAQTYSGSG